MSKYTDRILKEVDFNFDRHLHDEEERVEFLKELIEVLKKVLEYYDVGECGICPKSKCDCEPESCL